MKPIIGRIVHYKLNAADAQAINKRRGDAKAFQRATDPGAEPGMPGATGHQLHIGNEAEAGQVYPATVVRVFSPETVAGNLQVTLDGTDTYWATSRQEGDGEGSWAWPPRA